jgi:hypothetical protein
VQSKYRESRTLVRRLCRLPGEDKAEFKAKVLRLREHFQQFNVDTSELCQWIMGHRKKWVEAAPAQAESNPSSFGPLGDFLLEPSLDGVDADEKERDRWRVSVFDDVAGFRTIASLSDHPIPARLRNAMDAAAAVSPHTSAQRLFARLKSLQPQHRVVLLKSAAEWIVARYQRGVENWVRHRAEWETERQAWEAGHAALTPAIRDQYTNVFKQLKDDQREGATGLRKKNPRICSWDRLKQNIDNCCYAGQRGHGPLCRQYADFVKAQKERDTKFNDDAFYESASILAALCRKHNITRAGNALLSQPILDSMYKEVQQRRAAKYALKNAARKPDQTPAQYPSKSIDPARAKAEFLRLFRANWNAYLKHMNLSDSTAIERGELPHCPMKGRQWFEKSNCRWNPHTDLCLHYKRLIGQFDAATLALEQDARQWRKLYLAGPRKPSFKYPSAAELPMPKVFGKDFHEIDFDRSILRVRLDDMAEGQWMELGFTPWPRDYSPSRGEVASMVTSVHMQFIGSRARVGFRFEVPHKRSRFACSQDELDELRSRQFPRQAQDQQFIDAARKRLLEAFNGDAKRNLRVLAVDTGMKGAHVAVFHGKRCIADAALPIIKINKLYAQTPQKLVKEPKDRKMRGRLEFDDKTDTRGLRREHVGVHLKSIAEGATAIAGTRSQRESETVTLHDHDFRGRKRHIAWMVRDWARHNAAQIIAAAQEHQCDVIVFESLRGKRMPGYDQLGDDNERKKAEGVLYAYGRIRRKVTEKAVERGMVVVTAPYFKSSQVCCRCGKAQGNLGLWKKNKEKRIFLCEYCKEQSNSDSNAAQVLGRVFWGEIQLPAAQPDAAPVRG